MCHNTDNGNYSASAEASADVVVTFFGNLRLLPRQTSNACTVIAPIPHLTL